MYYFIIIKTNCSPKMNYFDPFYIKFFNSYHQYYIVLIEKFFSTKRNKNG